MPDQIRNVPLLNALSTIFPYGMVVYDSSLNCTIADQLACDMLHVKKTDIMQQSMGDLFYGIKHSSKFKKFCRNLEAGKPNSISFLREKEHFAARGFQVGGNYVLSLTNIPEEEYLQEEKSAELDALLSNISSQVFFKNCSFEYTSINKACAHFHARPIDQIIGKTDFELFPPDQAEIIRVEDQKVILDGETIRDVERILVNHKGDRIWVSTTKTPLRDANGKVSGLLGISFDITESKTAKAKIDLLVAAIEQTPEMIMITDTNGIIEYVNPAFAKTSGYLEKEAIGKSPSILKSGKHSDEFYENLWKTLREGKSWRGHFFNKRKDGSFFEGDAEISPVKSEGGKTSNFIAVMKDVTKDKKLEAQLMQSQKMEAIGRLAGGIAHDFNNILTAILGYSELLIKQLDKNDPSYGKVFEIRRAGKRAAALTNQMLAFSKKQVILRKEINVNEIISDMVDMLQRIIGENIKLTLDLEPELENIVSDVSQIEQIVMNLVINAKDAMPYKGALLNVKSKNTFLKKEFNDGNFNAHPGSYIMISVQDNGCGIGEDTTDHIFEPFYSKKVSANGTGLGLSTVYGIVKQHNGYIKIESSLDVGSTFKIYLPASSSGKKRELGEDTESGSVFQHQVVNETVLIVEDEEQVLDLSTAILKQAGYQVIKASSAEDAFHLFNKYKEEIDLVLTDAVLQGMNGFEFSQIIKAIKPDVKILFMSGYSGEVIEEFNINLSANNFILKPFTVDKLLKKVGEM